tara:strand:- start:327 stop:524 length:198 start_codon:yes stop_codon:yes gene_type:complete
MSKRFVGLWVSDETRKRMKVACAVHDVNQSDIMELLLMKWLDQPHVQEEVKDLINGKREQKRNGI